MWEFQYLKDHFEGTHTAGVVTIVGWGGVHSSVLRGKDLDEQICDVMCYWLPVRPTAFPEATVWTSPTLGIFTFKMKVLGTSAL